jgi:DnaK suppressor protein
MKQKNMKSQDLEHWKKVLLEERLKLTDELHETEKELLSQSPRDASGDLSGYSIHMADVGTDSFNREMNLAHISNEHGMVYEIDAALKRISEGTFGYCESCEKPIKKSRLKIVPFTRYCIQCKSKEESHPGSKP